MQSLFLLLVALASVNVATGMYCSGSPAPGERTNEYPIYDEAPRFVRSVKNAMLFEVGPPNATFSLVHLWGTPYEVGFAQGTLMKRDVTEFIKKTWGYLVSEMVEAMDGDRLPQWLKDLIVNQGMERALDWTISTTQKFTPQAYFDEMRGLADATGLDYDMIYRMNMFPELTKAQCSFFGAWGSAVGKENQAYQLRALDFDTTGPFKDYPQVTVYHPSDGGHAYSQVGWPGNLGALTGFSSEQIAVSEIGVSYPDDSFGQGTDNTPPEKVHGEPWMFILRDVLQFEDNLEGAKNRIANADRTCNLIIGVGSGKDSMANGCQFSGYVSNFYDDTNMLPVNETWHPVVTDAVYNGMDWLCPNYDSVLGAQLQKWHGSIDEVVTIHDILPTVQTGNLHVAVYDLSASNLHVSFCRSNKNDQSQPHYAYERQFTRLRMTEIFAQAPPTDV